MTLVRFRRRYKPSSKRKSRRMMRRSLGDKLQVLAEKSPTHLRAVEAVVDLILKHMSNARIMLGLVASLGV